MYNFWSGATHASPKKSWRPDINAMRWIQTGSLQSFWLHILPVPNPIHRKNEIKKETHLNSRSKNISSVISHGYAVSKGNHKDSPNPNKATQDQTGQSCPILQILRLFPSEEKKQIREASPHIPELM